MKKNLLSITELAKLRRVTSETLRYYDRIGLITPDFVDPKTRYRYYSIRQYEKLGTIKELRQLGMSIDDISTYFSKRNLKQSRKMLIHHQQLLEEEIREKQLLNETLQRKLRFLEELDSPPPVNRVLERSFPQRYMITFGEPAGGPREHAFAFTKLEWYLDEVAPILASDRVGVYADTRLLLPSDQYISAVPMLLVEQASIESEYKRAIPPGDYLCLDYHEGRLERYHASFELLKDYMKAHGWVVAGSILQFYRIDVTLTSDPRETLMEVQVPVKKATE